MEKITKNLSQILQTISLQNVWIPGVSSIKKLPLRLLFVLAVIPADFYPVKNITLFSRSQNFAVVGLIQSSSSISSLLEDNMFFRQ